MKRPKSIFCRLFAGLCLLEASSCHDFTITDNACINEKLLATKNEVYNIFENISSFQYIREARIMSYNNYSADIVYLNRKGDLRKVIDN